ncbi:TPA: AAA family ATPase [Klebsiella michiganensis]
MNVSITKLFGIFDHIIPFNQNSGVTIIIGENGIGKTKVLEAVNAIFNNDYNFLIELNFEKLVVLFDNKESWEFYRSIENEGSDIYIKRHVKNVSPKPDKLFTSNKIDTEKLKQMRFYEAEMDLEMEIIRNKIMRGGSSSEYQHLEKAYWERDFLKRKLKNHNEKITPPKWLITESKKITVRLIETQRIITRNETRKDSYTSMVTQCSNELKDLISNAIKSSADITSALDSTYPNRLITNLRKETDYTYTQLNDDLSDLNEKRKFLSTTGLVVDAQDSELAIIQHEHNDLILISMKQYVEDSKQKLEPYENLAQKINLFMSILSNRFKHKRLKVSKEDGIKFTSIITKKNNEPMEIGLTKLSSGEQHELVLFYKLIFNSTPGDLILIDEPELSLHISWQNQFIDDLKRVADINNFNAVIATHSPDIIASNWDLRVELEGIE